MAESGGLSMLASNEECRTPSSIEVTDVEHHCPRKNGATSVALRADDLCPADKAVIADDDDPLEVGRCRFEDPR